MHNNAVLGEGGGAVCYRDNQYLINRSTFSSPALKKKKKKERIKKGGVSFCCNEAMQALKTNTGLAVANVSPRDLLAFTFGEKW